MFLRQVAEQVGGGGVQAGHSGRSHSGRQSPALLFLRQVAEQPAGSALLLPLPTGWRPDSGVAK